jgi:hypothetical protein
MDVETFKKAIGPLLKEHEFSRSSATWRKRQEESFAVLNVQNSQWGEGDYYINLGTYFYALGSDSAPTANKCHVQVRTPVGDPAEVIASAIHWFQARALLRDAKALADTDSKKGLVLKELRVNALT